GIDRGTGAEGSGIVVVGIVDGDRGADADLAARRLARGERREARRIVGGDADRPDAVAGAADGDVVADRRGGGGSRIFDGEGAGDADLGRAGTGISLGADPHGIGAGRRGVGEVAVRGRRGDAILVDVLGRGGADADLVCAADRRAVGDAGRG